MLSGNHEFKKASQSLHFIESVQIEINQDKATARKVKLQTTKFKRLFAKKLSEGKLKGKGIL
jgi:hypothetical protein